jgi:hypothetical protein
MVAMATIARTATLATTRNGVLPQRAVQRQAARYQKTCDNVISDRMPTLSRIRANNQPIFTLFALDVLLPAYHAWGSGQIRGAGRVGSQ